MSLLAAERIGAQRPAQVHVPPHVDDGDGDAAVEVARASGLELDEWQEWVLRTSLHEDAQNQWSAFEVATFVSRQNGKGSIMEARQIAGLTVLEERLQVHTAHEFKTCYEHFLRVVNLVESNPELDRMTLRVRRGAGEQAIEFKNGCRLRFLARTSSSGRGLSGDCVYLDEAFALTHAMMGALLPTLSARENPQVWYMSSASRIESEVMHNIVERGREGSSPRLFYADWGLDAGVDMTDTENWYKANPALGIRISHEFVESEYEAMMSMPAEFARERLGVHEGLEGDTGKIRVADWDALADEDSAIVGMPSIALDVSPERSWSSFAAAGRRHDGLGHVELIERERGTGWVLEFAEKLYAKQKTPIRIDPASPAGAFIPELVERGVEVIEVKAREMTQACGSLLDAVINEQLRHLGHVTLRSAIVGAKERPVGDAWAWSRISSAIDISALVAVTLAWSGVPKKQERGYFLDVT